MGKVGRGATIDFWRYCWIETDSHNVVFPVLFQKFAKAKIEIDDASSLNNGVWEWNFVGSVQLSDASKQELNNLLKILCGILPNLDSPDKFVQWCDDICYSIKVAFVR